jgi:hypothetical protein
MISSAFATHVHKALSPSQSQPFLRQVFCPCILVYSEATLGRLQRPWFDAGGRSFLLRLYLLLFFVSLLPTRSTSSFFYYLPDL